MQCTSWQFLYFGVIIPINKGFLFIIFNVVNLCAVVYIVTVNQSLSYLIPMPLVPTKLRKTFFSLISFPPTDVKPATLVFFSWDKTIKTGLNKKTMFKTQDAARRELLPLIQTHTDPQTATSEGLQRSWLWNIYNLAISLWKERTWIKVIPHINQRILYHSSDR